MININVILLNFVNFNFFYKLECYAKLLIKISEVEKFVHMFIFVAS